MAFPEICMEMQKVYASLKPPAGMEEGKFDMGLSFGEIELSNPTPEEIFFWNIRGYSVVVNYTPLK